MSILRAWRALTWKHWAWAIAIPIAIAMTMPVQNFHQNWYWAMWRFPFFVSWLHFFYGGMVFLVAVVGGRATADTAAPRGGDSVVLRLASTVVDARCHRPSCW